MACSGIGMMDCCFLCSKSLLIQGTISKSATILVVFNSCSGALLCESSHKADPCVVVIGMALCIGGNV